MRAILPVVAAILLTGCGLKNDLYLPDPDSTASEPAQSDTDASEPTHDDDDDAANP